MDSSVNVGSADMLGRVQPIVGSDDLYSVNNNEINAVSLVSDVLIGRENYISWKKYMEIALSARSKLEFVYGKFPKPSDPALAMKWQRCNDAIMTWLLNSSSKEVQDQIIQAENVAAAWEILEARFAGSSVSRKFALEQEIAGLVQGEMDVAKYFNKLSNLWHKLEAMKKSNACAMNGNCAKCQELEKEKQEGKVMKFLMGLSESNSLIRTHILALRELPDLNTAFDYVSQEEMHRRITHSVNVEASAMYASNGGKRHYGNTYNQNNSVQSGNGDSVNRSASVVNNGKQGYSSDNDVISLGHNVNNNYNSGRGRSKGYCNHCGIPGHNKESCYKLIGFPPYYRNGRGAFGRNGGRGGNRNFANLAVNTKTESEIVPDSDRVTESTPQLTSDQVCQLLSLLKPSVEGSNEKISSQMYMAGTVYAMTIADNQIWIVDSGASNHFVCDNNMLTDLSTLPNPCYINLPNGQNVKVIECGKCILKNGLCLNDVLLVPQFKYNLLSVSRLTSDSGYSVTFTNDECIVQDPQRRSILKTGKRHGGLYFFEDNGVKLEGQLAATARDASGDGFLKIWHNRLGHMPFNRMKQFLLSKFPHVKSIKDEFQCVICPLARQCKLSFKYSEHNATQIFQLVHCDVWGPFHVPTMNGSRYFLSIVDDYSRALWTFLMKSKSETGDLIMQFSLMVNNQFDKHIKVLRSDNGTEFMNDKLKRFLSKKGIMHQTSCTHTPQQNGLVERRHRHILEIARALKFQANVSKIFWGDCVLTATYIINRIPSSVLRGKTPYEILFGEPPSLEHLRSFGCLCFVSTLSHQCDKFDARADACIFLGYPHAQKGYKLYSLKNHRILVSRHVIFHESVFPFHQDKSAVTEESGAPFTSNTRIISDDFFTDDQPDSNEPSDSVLVPEIFPIDPLGSTPAETADELFVHNDENYENERMEPVSNEAPHAEEEPIRKSLRQCKLPAWHSDYVIPKKRTSPHQLNNFLGYSSCSKEYHLFLTKMDKLAEPTSFKQAQNDKRWIEAMEAEINALEDNKTWMLTELPTGKSTVDCKWIFKIKHNPDGSVERFKARLVARGFTQIEGLDYHETFAPVIKFDTIRCVLSIAAVRNWSLHQLDVNNAFLNGILEEEVYMKTPPGFYLEAKKKGLVCKLIKSIYGLKQASRQWFTIFAETLTSFGFNQSLHDYSLFTMSKHGQFVALLVYVDDIILTGDSADLISEVKCFIHSKFKTKDMGHLRYFLGLELARSSAGIFLNQRKYCVDLLHEYQFEDSKPAITPMDAKHSLSLSTAEILQDAMPYRRLVGRLIYLAITRPDLAHPVHVLSQYLHCPTTDHMKAAHRVLRYLKHAPGQGLMFSANSSLNLSAYCDADWAACPITRRSVSGYCMLLGNSLVAWKTKKQSLVSRSSAESEYRAMAAATSEISWIVGVLSDLQVHCSLPIPLYCDNQAALHLSRNPVFHERTKHIEIDCHFVRQFISSGFINTLPIRSPHQLADLFTKPMPLERLSFFLPKLGVSNHLHAPACGGV